MIWQPHVIERCVTMQEDGGYTAIIPPAFFPGQRSNLSCLPSSPHPPNKFLEAIQRFPKDVDEVWLPLHSGFPFYNMFLSNNQDGR